MEKEKGTSSAGLSSASKLHAHCWLEKAYSGRKKRCRKEKSLMPYGCGKVLETIFLGRDSELDDLEITKR